MKRDDTEFYNIREKVIYDNITKKGVAFLGNFSPYRFYDEYPIILSAVKKYFEDIKIKISDLLPDDKTPTYEMLSKASILNSIRINEFKSFNKIKTEKMQEYANSLKTAKEANGIKRTGHVIEEKLNEFSTKKEKEINF